MNSLPASLTSPKPDRVIALSLLAAALLPSSASAQFSGPPGNVLIASKASSPEVGGQFWTLYGPVGIDGSGRVAFAAPVQVGAQVPYGLFRGDGSMPVNKLAWSGDTVGTSVLQEVSSNGVATNMITPAGYACFEAVFQDPPSKTNRTGLFLRTPSGVLYRMAYEGESAPGGGTFTNFDSAIWTVSPNGNLVFFTSTAGGPGRGFYFATLNGTIPVITPVAVQGDTAPGTDGTFNPASYSLFSQSRVAVNDAGLVVFQCYTSNGSQAAFYQWDGTTIVKVANSTGASNFRMNNAGKIIFGPTGSGELLRYGDATSNVVVAQVGGAAPDGGTYGFLLTGPLALNEAGQVLFSTITSNSSLYLWHNGTTKALATPNTAAPGGGTLQSFDTALLSNTGYVVFKGHTSGGDRIFLSDGTETVAAVSTGDVMNGEYVVSVQLGATAPYFNEGSINDGAEFAYFGGLNTSSTANFSDQTLIMRFTPPARWWAGGSGDWDTAGHWKFNFTPGPQRDVIIDPSSSATITGPAADGTVRTLQAGGGGVTTRLELAAGTTVTTTNGLTIKPFGVLAGPGKVAGDLTNDGTQEMLSTDPVKNLGAATSTNRSHLAVSLLDNTATFGGMTAASVTIQGGAQVDLTLNASGSTVDFTQAFWQARHVWKLVTAPTVSGSLVLGAGNNPATLLDANGVAATAYGAFSVAVTTGAVELRWAPFQTVPDITTPPAGKLVALGAPLALTTVATGNGLDYLWFKNSASLPLETSDTFSVAAATLANAGNYKVRVHNELGTKTSAEVSVGVVDQFPHAVGITEDTTLTLTVSAAAPAGKVFGYQWKKGSTALVNGSAGPVQVISGATSAKLSITRADLSTAGAYACEVSLTGLTPMTSGTFTVTVTPETIVPPAPVIKAPAAGASFVLTNGGTVTVSGTATDNHAVARVLVRLNGGMAADATLTAAGSPSTGFSLPVTPVGGVNTITVQTLDANNNASALATRSFNSIVVRSLTVLVSPAGTGTVPLPVSTFNVGFPYTLTAKPNAGKVFNGWTVNDPTGTGITPAKQELPALTFIHQDNLMLTANFIDNPFTAAVIGSFNGLVEPSLAVPAGGTVPGNNTVGFLNAVVTGTGAVTGTLKLDGTTLPFAGVFDNTGVARFGNTRATTLIVPRLNKPGVEMSLQLDLTNGTGKLKGTVVQRLRSTVVAQSDIEADRAAYSATAKMDSLLAATAVKAYTVAFKHRGTQPGLTTADYPQGDGYATVTIKNDGTVTLAGKLADHTALAQTVPLSKGSTWPLFNQLYASLQGSFSALMTLATTMDTDVAGSAVHWFRPYQSVQWYPWGWDEGIDVEVVGARYTPPALPGLLPVDVLTGNATLAFSDGGLSGLVTRNVNIHPTTSAATRAPVTDTSYTFALTPASGLVSGSFTHSDASKPTWQGVLLQKGANKGGYGYFLTVSPKVLDGTGVSGRVELRAK